MAEKSGGSWLGFDEWREALTSCKELYDFEPVDAQRFSGLMQPLNLFGIHVHRLSGALKRVERTHRHISRDDSSDYHAVLTVSGRSLLNQNRRTLEMRARGIVLFDTARPVTLQFDEAGWGEAYCLCLPRQALISHLGFEPQGGAVASSGTPADRLFLQLLQEALTAQRSVDGLAASEATQGGHYMKLMIYDLIGAMFGSDKLPVVSTHTQKLYLRICSLIEGSF